MRRVMNVVLYRDDKEPYKIGFEIEGEGDEPLTKQQIMDAVSDMLVDDNAQNTSGVKPNFEDYDA